MVRTTVLIPSKLKKKAEKMAASIGISFGELIRVSLNQVLKGESSKNADDPFFLDKEVYTKSKLEDLSLNHDDYLYGKKK